MNKTISLTREEMAILKDLKKNYGFKSDSQTISFLLHQTKQEKREIAVLVRQELEENYLPKDRIKWGTKTAEQNSILLLDAINTLLHMLKAENCIPVEVAEHAVISQSRGRLKQKIAYFKQKSDERKSKMQ